MKKYVDTLCEDMVRSDESIFMWCFVNRRVYKVVNKQTKYIMGFIKIFVNDFRIKVKDVEDDVNDILHDIVVHALMKNKKIVGDKKISLNVFIAPLDDVSFHYEESC